MLDPGFEADGLLGTIGRTIGHDERTAPVVIGVVIAAQEWGNQMRDAIALALSPSGFACGDEPVPPRRYTVVEDETSITLQRDFVLTREDLALLVGRCAELFHDHA